jgi:hypothetical protein
LVPKPRWEWWIKNGVSDHAWTRKGASPGPFNSNQSIMLVRVEECPFRSRRRHNSRGATAMMSFEGSERTRRKATTSAADTITVNSLTIPNKQPNTSIRK